MMVPVVARAIGLPSARGAAGDMMIHLIGSQ